MEEVSSIKMLITSEVLEKIDLIGARDRYNQDFLSLIGSISSSTKYYRQANVDELIQHYPTHSKLQTLNAAIKKKESSKEEKVQMILEKNELVLSKEYISYVAFTKKHQSCTGRSNQQVTGTCRHKYARQHRIHQAINDKAEFSDGHDDIISEGGLISDGYDPELDALPNREMDASSRRNKRSSTATSNQVGSGPPTRGLFLVS